MSNNFCKLENEGLFPKLKGKCERKYFIRGVLWDCPKVQKNMAYTFIHLKNGYNFEVLGYKAGKGKIM